MKKVITILLCLIALTITAKVPEELESILRDIKAQSMEFKDSEEHKTIRNSRETRDYALGDTETFWRWDLSNMPPSWIQTPSTCRAVGNHCYIFVADSEWNTHMTQADVDTALNHFENTTPNHPTQGIYDLNTSNFGPVPDELDNDPKMIIFYSALGSFNGSSFDGYFSSYNQVTESQAQQMNPPGHSNECEMIYMTCHPLDPIEPIRLSVLAHEMQHLIHWGMDINEDTWVDEGCAEFAMHLYGVPDPIVSFPSNPDDNLTSWDQHFADYVQTYLFMVYLSENYGGNSIISQIVSEPANSINGIQDALSHLGETDSFETIFANWTNSNFLDDYQTIDLPNFSVSGSYSNLPIQDTGTVQGWASDYYRINSGDNPFTINFTGATGQYYVSALMIDNDDDSIIVPMPITANTGTLNIPAFDPDYDSVVINICNISNTPGTYSFEVNEILEDQREFYVYNYLSSTHSIVTATSHGWGDHCNVYVDDSLWELEVTQADVDLVVRVFEDSTAANPNQGIFEIDTATFGMPSDIDNNGKINILIFDIDDDGINGYFSGLDLMNAGGSNQMEIIYIDKNPHGSGINSTYCFSTIAHELQHLIHFEHDTDEETWVNEGLSGLAQSVTGWISPYWMMMYTANPDNNLTEWSAGADYPQCYLFMQYLYEHYNLNDQQIIENIVANDTNGMSGIASSLNTTGWVDITIEEVYMNWLTANYVNNSSVENGLYSYQSNPIGTGQFSINNAATHTTYPASGSLDTQHWGVDYLKFNSFQESFKLTFFPEDTNQSFTVRAVAYDNGNPVAVIDLDNTGEMELASDVYTYDEVVLIVTCTEDGTGTAGYYYLVEDLPISNEDNVNSLVDSFHSYPNPFIDNVSLQINLKQRSNISISVYNVKGQLVRELVKDIDVLDSYSLEWDGKQEDGSQSGNGIYFLRMSINNESFIRKVMLLKK